LSTTSIPKGVATYGDICITVTASEILISQNGTKVASQQTTWSSLSVAIHPSGKEVAIGGEDGKVHLYSLEDTALIAQGQLEDNRGGVTGVAFSPNGELLAAADKERNVLVYDWQTKKVLYHCAFQNSLLRFFYIIIH